VSVATPLAFSGAVPRTVVPSRKVMVPVGVPELELAVAVSTTLAFTLAGFTELVRLRFVASVWTVSLRTGEVAAL
jgi:hypothetical protein